MQGISSDDLVVQLVRLIPEVKPFLEEEAEREGLRAAQVTHWEQLDIHPMNFLSNVLVYPLLKPLMRSPELDAEQKELLERCFEFIEALEEDPTGWLVTTAYHAFLEFFLDGEEVLDRAVRFAWPKTRKEILDLVKGWNAPMDPSWDDLE